MSGKQRRINSYFRVKKTKRGGARIDSETRAALAATKVHTPVIHHSSRQFGEKKKFYSKSQGKMGGGAMSLQRITNMLCPIFSYKRIGYGNSWANRAHNHLSGTYPLKAGTVKSMHWGEGQQYWNEFIGLPLHNFGGTTAGHTDAFTYDGFHASVSELIAKAADIRNDVQATHITRPLGTLTMVQTVDDNVLDETLTPKALKNWLGLCFDYLGGYQEHTFTNTSGHMITVFLQEAQPREVMTGLMRDPAATTKIVTRNIGRDLLLDYKADLPLANTLRPMYTEVDNNNASTNSLSDPCVKINSHSNNVHRKYLISKEEKVTLAPGDSYTHKMVFPAFNFTESTFNTLSSMQNDLISTTAFGGQSQNLLPMLIPMFTKILIVRARSEIGYGTTGEGGQTYIATVGQLPGAMTHTCTEKHSCRMMPMQIPRQSFVDYNLDGADIDYTINNESNRGEIVLDSGLANF